MGAVAAIGEGLFELGLEGDELDAPLRRGYGGDAANVLVMAARAGAETRLCGRVGDDAFGRLLLAFWRQCGIDTRFVHTDDAAPTGIYVNESAADGHRFHYHRSGSAGSRLAAGDVTDAFLDGIDLVHLTGITLSISASAADAARTAADRARATGTRVSFAVNHRPALSPDGDALIAAARAADIVFIADDEAERLLREREPDRIAAALGCGEQSELVVTSGRLGAAVLVAGEWTAAAAPAVEVVDAAGAGDALAGCYLAERVSGTPPAEALHLAVCAASLSCTRWGCAASYPDRVELDAFL
jgi:2-dehydro-3-deoxygluconokinase